MENRTEYEPARVRKALGFYEQAVARIPDSRGVEPGLGVPTRLAIGDVVPTPAEMASRARRPAERRWRWPPGRPKGYTARLEPTAGWSKSTISSVPGGVRRGDAPRARHRRAARGFDRSGRRGPRGAGSRRSTTSGRHERLDPRSVIPSSELSGSVAPAAALSRGARGAIEQGARSRARQPAPIENKTMTFLAQGDLPARRP